MSAAGGDHQRRLRRRFMKPGAGEHAASKAGIVGMTKSMAKELGSRGITANCVAPGYVETAMTADLPEKVVSEQIAMVPAGRMGRLKRSLPPWFSSPATKPVPTARPCTSTAA